MLGIIVTIKMVIAAMRRIFIEISSLKARQHLSVEICTE